MLSALIVTRCSCLVVCVSAKSYTVGVLLAAPDCSFFKAAERSSLQSSASPSDSATDVCCMAWLAHTCVSFIVSLRNMAKTSVPHVRALILWGWVCHVVHHSLKRNPWTGTRRNTHAKEIFLVELYNWLYIWQLLSSFFFFLFTPTWLWAILLETTDLPGISLHVLFEVAKVKRQKGPSSSKFGEFWTKQQMEQIYD